jgi:hypothetical protein
MMANVNYRHWQKHFNHAINSNKKIHIDLCVYRHVMFVCLFIYLYKYVENLGKKIHIDTQGTKEMIIKHSTKHDKD